MNAKLGDMTEKELASLYTLMARGKVYIPGITGADVLQALVYLVGFDEAMKSAEETAEYLR